MTTDNHKTVIENLIRSSLVEYARAIKEKYSRDIGSVNIADDTIYEKYGKYVSVSLEGIEPIDDMNLLCTVITGKLNHAGYPHSLIRYDVTKMKYVVIVALNEICDASPSKMMLQSSRVSHDHSFCYPCIRVIKITIGTIMFICLLSVIISIIYPNK